VIPKPGSRAGTNGIEDKKRQVAHTQLPSEVWPLSWQHPVPFALEVTPF